MKVEKKRALTFQQRGSKNERKNDNSISFEISTRPRAAATGQRPGPQLRPSHMVWEMSFRISVLTQKTRAPKEVPQRSDFLQSLFAPAGLLDFFFVEPKCAFRQRPEFDMYSCIKSCHSKCYVQQHCDDDMVRYVLSQIENVHKSDSETHRRRDKPDTRATENWQETNNYD